MHSKPPILAFLKNPISGWSVTCWFAFLFALSATAWQCRKAGPLEVLKRDWEASYVAWLDSGQWVSINGAVADCNDIAKRLIILDRFLDTLNQRQGRDTVPAALAASIQQTAQQWSVFRSNPDQYNLYPSLNKMIAKQDWEGAGHLLQTAPEHYQCAIQLLQSVGVKTAKSSLQSHERFFQYLQNGIQSDWNAGKGPENKLLIVLPAAEAGVKEMMAFCKGIALDSIRIQAKKSLIQ